MQNKISYLGFLILIRGAETEEIVLIWLRAKTDSSVWGVSLIDGDTSFRLDTDKICALVAVYITCTKKIDECRLYKP